MICLIDIPTRAGGNDDSASSAVSAKAKCAELAPGQVSPITRKGLTARGGLPAAHSKAVACASARDTSTDSLLIKARSARAPRHPARLSLARIAPNPSTHE